MKSLRFDFLAWLCLQSFAQALVFEGFQRVVYAIPYPKFMCNTGTELFRKQIVSMILYRKLLNVSFGHLAS